MSNLSHIDYEVWGRVKAFSKTQNKSVICVFNYLIGGWEIFTNISNFVPKDNRVNSFNELRGINISYLIFKAIEYTSDGVNIDYVSINNKIGMLEDETIKFPHEDWMIITC